MEYSVVKQGQSGFVLVATLWVLAGLSLVAAYFAEMTERSVSNAIQSKSQLEEALELQANQQTLLYLLASRQKGIAGIVTDGSSLQRDDMGGLLLSMTGNEIRSDGREYAGLGDIGFSIQDEGGLISINNPSSRYFDRLLENQGVTLQDRQVLIARISDYISQSDLASLNGAATSDYEKAGWLPPTKRFMQSPLELARVLGWNEFLTQQQFDAIVAGLSATPTQFLNFNSITETYLQTLPELDAASIAQILKHRETGAFISLADVNQVTGRIISLDPLDLSFVGSDYYRIKVWQNGTTQTQLFGVKLTPFSKVAPWRILYNYQVSEGHHGAESVANTASPLFKTTLPTE